MLNRIVVLALVLVLTSLFTGCTGRLSTQTGVTPEATPTSILTSSPTPTAMSTVSPTQQFEVTNIAFFDYNGNGNKEGSEPAISGIKLTYQPGNTSCVTDKNGLGTVKVPAGSYTVLVDDSSGIFKYILSSVSEFSNIQDGLKVNISNKEEVMIPLAQGFMTWPFTPYTSVGMIYFFDPEDPAIDPLSMCHEGTWAIEQYSGLYIGNVNAGTELIAPAPLTITDYQPRTGKAGGVLVVSYGNNAAGYFIYTSLADGINVGDFVPRGKVFARTEPCDSGDMHIHLFLIISSSVVDPYLYLTEYRIPHHAG